MDPAQIITTLMGVGGVGVLVGQFVRWLMKRADGSSARERERNTSIVTQRQDAVLEAKGARAEAAEADRKRRLAEEDAARLRRKLILAGLDPGEEPDYARTGKPPVPRRKR